MNARILQPLGWILLATSAALAVWLIAGPIFGVPFAVEVSGRPAMTITPMPILAVTAVSGLAAWALLLLLRRYRNNGIRIWKIAAAVVLVLSAGGPLAAEAAMTTKVVLILMHIVVAATLIVGLPRTLADHTVAPRTGGFQSLRTRRNLGSKAPS